VDAECAWTSCLCVCASEVRLPARRGGKRLPPDPMLSRPPPGCLHAGLQDTKDPAISTGLHRMRTWGPMPSQLVGVIWGGEVGQEGRQQPDGPHSEREAKLFHGATSERVRRSRSERYQCRRRRHQQALDSDGG